MRENPILYRRINSGTGVRPEFHRIRLEFDRSFTGYDRSSTGVLPDSTGVKRNGPDSTGVDRSQTGSETELNGSGKSNILL